MQMTRSGPVDPDDLRTLPTSECALILLQSLSTSPNVNAHNTMRGAEQAYRHNGERDIPQLLERLSDAWAWLESHGLLGPDPTQSAGWQRVTSRGRTLAVDPGALSVIVAEDRLSMDLHPLLEAKVRRIFTLGDLETAAFAAMKEVEVRVRALAGVGDSVLGVNLMRSAFRKDGGSLVDQGADPGEQVATMELFAGAIGTFKNPASHRTVDYDDPTEAAEVVLLADLLMRLLDRVEVRLNG
jgi:uncharacterized protein (TIGR02391 family)